MKENRQKILRYAQLTFKREMLSAQNQQLADEDEKERLAIPAELGLSHEEILDLAAKNLIDETEC